MISELGVANSSAEVHPAGTVALSRTASVGFSCILGRDMATSQDFATWTCGPALSPKYLLYALRAQPHEIERRKAGSTHKTIYMPDIETLRIPLPPVACQERIVEYLDTKKARIDALITKKRELIRLVDERFESAVFAAVACGLRGEPLRASGLSWVSEIPHHWGTPTVSVNFDLQLGKMLSGESAQGPEQHPYVRNVNVQWDRFDLRDLATMHFSAEDRRRCALRRGDVLVCEGGEVGRAAVWPGDPSDCYFQKAIHRARPRKGANGRYLMYCLRAAAKRNVFEVEGHSSTIVHLTGEQLRVHRFPWPPADEQDEIVRFLEAEAARTGAIRPALTRQITLLAEHRQALITAAVTGELPVPGVAE